MKFTDHLRLFQLVKSALQTLQDVNDDLNVVLVLLEHPLDFRQNLPPDGHVVHVLVHVHYSDQRRILDGRTREED